MRPLDFIILMLCCVGWAANFVISAWAVGNNPVPPYMLAAIRAAIVLLIMGVFLFKPRPEKFLNLLIVCACVGPIHLGFLYTGLQTASASASSIISQIMIPFATILSVIFLKEKIGWVRGTGIAIAFVGVIVMVYEPGAVDFDMGLIMIVCAYFSLAVGSIVMKTVGDIDWKIYVAWMAVMVFIVMAVASFLFEDNHVETLKNDWKPLLITATYAAIAASILAHGQYFNLIRKYEVSQVVPLTLMVPVFATIFGVQFLGEELTKPMLIGGALILPCVYIIAKRQNIAPVQED